MAIAQAPDDQVVQDEVVEETEQVAKEDIFDSGSPLVKQKHHWWYYLLVMLLFGVLVAGIIWLVYTSYVSYTNWYNTSLQQSFASGKAYGVAVGVQQGAKVQKGQDAVSLTKALAKVKASDAKSLLKAKFTSYQSGKQDAMNVSHMWWINHCSYDNIIHRYVCNSSL